jgi:uncharacterized membrane protein YraQ (UPF0718 family)
MVKVLRREAIYLWFYFSIQFDQIFKYWALGIFLGFVISAFGKQMIHQMFEALQKKKSSAFGVIPASILGIASPLCMYSTIPLLQTWMYNGMSMGQAASFMISGSAMKITNLGVLKIVLRIKHFLFYVLFSVFFTLLSGFAVDYLIRYILYIK